MGEWTQLTAPDGHELSAYFATPSQEAAGSLIILQEIFGVNGHIRSVVDGYAEAGYLTIAPALFDRAERNVDLAYDGEGTQKGMALMQKLEPATTLKDIAAAFEYLKKARKGIGAVGFCYGGLMTWLTATRGETVGMRLGCCVGYYAGGIGKFAGEEPSCPVMLHFGAQDTHIGQDQVEAVRAAHPEVEVYLYGGAGHAFANDVRASYREEAAALARVRTMEFLRMHLA
jgi:carboxymethylenebutenolidase